MEPAIANHRNRASGKALQDDSENIAPCIVY